MYRSPARYLAPVALIGCLLAIVLIVAIGGDKETSGGAAGPRAPATSSARGAPSAARTYTVRPGDILSAIAERTGIPVNTLMELNPDIDPRALVPGQRLVLRR
jgi:LysM repeat protein